MVYHFSPPLLRVRFDAKLKITPTGGLFSECVCLIIYSIGGIYQSPTYGMHRAAYRSVYKQRATL